ncbi:YhcN/YlaJ family sporulation lipoprotein [Paenibacillus sanguinis]|uniref:YhcN/YlaJ family sporulation lipoprotein n=1 Tax=Paenibacillus sanguinis TaxID=225906 RepID=UPI00037AA99A|nr:YhcN/YlaJ family sporulation lipoprotein [Paenibacillus sanguinis]
MRGSKIVHLSLSAALVAGVGGIAGCGNADNNMRTQSLRNNHNRGYNINSMDSMDRNQRMNTRNTGNGQERIQSLRYSQALSNKVAQLGSVQAAHVVVTDHDAYVGVTLHGNRQNNGNGMNTGRNEGTGMDMLGAGSKGVNMNRSRALNSTDRMPGVGMNGHRDTSMYGTTGTEMINRSPNENGIGLGMGDMGLGMGVDNIGEDVREQITTAIKQTAPHIRNVYVSGNTDFVDQIGNYGMQSRAGRTLNHYINDFETMINRIFPGDQR